MNEIWLPVACEMSNSSQPITSSRFAAALQDLPLSSLHSTAAEIRNSQVHLESSNTELKPHADEGDTVCKEAIEENLEVIERMKGRLRLLKAEVERRGMPWVEDEATKSTTNGYVNEEDQVEQSELGEVESERHERTLISDEELQKRMEEQLNEQDQDEEDGMHL